MIKLFFLWVNRTKFMPMTNVLAYSGLMIAAVQIKCHRIMASETGDWKDRHRGLVVSLCKVKCLQFQKKQVQQAVMSRLYATWYSFPPASHAYLFVHGKTTVLINLKQFNSFS